MVESLPLLSSYVDQLLEPNQPQNPLVCIITRRYPPASPSSCSSADFAVKSPVVIPVGNNPSTSQAPVTSSPIAQGGSTPAYSSPISAPALSPLSSGPSFSSSDEMPSPAVGDNDDGVHDVTVVMNNKKRKERSSESPLSPVAKQSKPSTSPLMTPRSQPAAAPRTIVLQTPASPVATSVPRSPATTYSRPPPPILIRDQTAWTRANIHLQKNGFSIVSSALTPAGTRVQVARPIDHRELTKFLRSNRLAYSSYQIPEEKAYHFILRPVPVGLTTSAIKDDLIAQNIPVLEVHRLHREFLHPSHPTKPFGMVLVTTKPTEAGRRLRSLSSICGLPSIKVETPNSKSTIQQCHNCQLYGHSQLRCFGPSRCVKCAGNHATALCEKDASTPPTCALCGQTGHPANYGGCPAAPGRNRRWEQGMLGQSFSQRTFIPSGQGYGPRPHAPTLERHIQRREYHNNYFYRNPQPRIPSLLDLPLIEPPIYPSYRHTDISRRTYASVTASPNHFNYSTPLWQYK